MYSTQDIIEKMDKYSARNYKPLPVVLDQAQGVWVTDIEGKKYIDMLSCYSALNFGHRHPRIVEALKDQIEKITLTSRAFLNSEMALFMEELCSFCGLDMALAMNSGAEAVETAIKAARKWAYTKKKIPRDKAEIIVCENNFHGRTVSIISFSTEPLYRDGFGPFTPGFKVIPYGDTDALEKAITPHSAAFLVEPIQGEAGVRIPPSGFLTKCFDICKKYNILFMADEIQTGFGRTGRRFCCDWESVKPDMLILGKALGGGIYPVSAAAAKKEVMDVFSPGEHGSTFGGNPLASALGRISLKVLTEERLAERSLEQGQFLIESLKTVKSRFIKEIRGRGLFVGIELHKEAGGARRFCEALQKQGVLCKETHDDVIRFAPPLIITKDELEWALKRVEKVFSEIE